MCTIRPMDFYSLLHLPRNATNLNILDNYRKHIIYSSEKELLSEAFEVLTSSFRQIYDSFGYGILHNGLPEMGEFKGFPPYKYHGDWAETVKLAFDTDLEFLKSTQMIESVAPLKVVIKKLPDKKLFLDVTMEEIYFGCQKLIKLENSIFENGAIVTKTKELLVDIPCGALPGYVVTFREYGDVLPHSIANDVVVTLNIVGSTQYTRQGLNLRTTVPVSLKTRLCGGTVVVPLINGNTETIYVIGEEQMIKKAGLTSAGVYGDLIVSFSVTYPVLNPATKLKIASLLDKNKSI